MLSMRASIPSHSNPLRARDTAPSSIRKPILTAEGRRIGDDRETYSSIRNSVPHWKSFPSKGSRTLITAGR